MRKLILLCFFLISRIYSQEKYPSNYFDSPLKIPIIFSGTFGELRSNHFHAGIDIKTQQKINIPIYAPADGYVCRIAIKQFGYGKALYIKHPNGFTTVYAHLNKFNESIQRYVKSVQYSLQKYSFSRYLRPSEFKVKRGDIIAYSGDTGSSGGPHLHYEVRDSETDELINPMHFGVTTPDTKAPRMTKLMAFPLSDSSRIDNRNTPVGVSFRRRSSGQYVARQLKAIGLIGFGVSVFDNQDLASNRNGIYSLEMKVNGNRVYYHDLETFSFNESKYINLLIDYKQYVTTRVRYQKTHKEDSNLLSIYKDLVNKGKLEVKPNQNYNVEIIAKDFHGNRTSLIIPVKGVENLKTFKTKDTTEYKVYRDKYTRFEKGKVVVDFPRNTFYEDVFIDFKVRNGVVKIHRPIIPLHKKFKIAYDISHLSSSKRDKVYLANINSKYPSYIGSVKKGNKLYATLKTLGTYSLKFDKYPPTIRLLNFRNNRWLTSNKTLKVRIRDRGTGIKDYKATIDGQWILMEYNHKKGILTYDFSDKGFNGVKHTFSISVYDKVGNVSTKIVNFSKRI